MVGKSEAHSLVKLITAVFRIFPRYPLSSLVHCDTRWRATGITTQRSLEWVGLVSSNEQFELTIISGYHGIPDLG